MGAIKKEKVSSIANLRLVSGLLVGNTIDTDSYYGDNNGGGNQYRCTYLNAASHPDSPAIDNGGNIIITTDGKVLESDNQNNLLNVKKFGAKGDNAQDDIVMINTAIQSLVAKGGKLYFPPGTYLVSDTVLVDASYIGLKLSPGAIIKNTNTTTGTFHTTGGLIHEVVRFQPKGQVQPVYPTNRNPHNVLTTIASEYIEDSDTLEVVNASNIDVGDIITIRSTEPLHYGRAYYNKSYRTTVHAKSGNILTIHRMPISFKFESDPLYPKEIYATTAPSQSTNFWATRRYKITEPSAGTELFTDLGAPNNNIGTEFYATSDSTAGAYTAGEVTVLPIIEIYKELHITGNSIDGGSIDIGNKHTLSGEDLHIKGISFRECVDFTIGAASRITVLDGTKHAIYTAGSLNGIINKTSHICETEWNDTRGIWAIYASGSQNITITENYARNYWSAVDANLSYHIKIVNNEGDNCGIDPHSGKDYIIHSNKIGDEGLALRAMDMDVRGNVIKNAKSPINISEGANQGFLNIIGNTLVKDHTLTPGDGSTVRFGIYNQSTNTTPSKLTRKQFHDHTITGNKIRGYHYGIRCYSSSSEYGNKSTNVNISNNDIKDFTIEAMSASWIKDGTFNGNQSYMIEEYRDAKAYNSADVASLVSVVVDPLFPALSRINTSRSDVYYLPKGADATIIGNWIDIGIMPVGMAITGTNEKVTILHNNIDGAFDRSYYVAGVDELKIQTIVRNINSYAYVNDATMQRDEVYFVPYDYQPLRNLETIRPSDLYFYNTYAGSTTTAYYKTRRGSFISRSALTNAFSAGNRRSSNREEGFGIASSYGIIGAFAKIDKFEGSELHMTWNSPAFKFRFKPFDANGDIIDDGGSQTGFTSNLVLAWDDTNKMYYHSPYVGPEDKLILTFTDDTIKSVFIGVDSSGDVPGKEIVIEAKGLSLLYANQDNVNRVSNVQPDSGFHRKGDLYYNLNDMKTQWLCTAEGDFEDVGSEPTFELIREDTVSSIAGLKALVNVPIGAEVRTTGYWQNNDGGGSRYFKVTDIGQVDNLGTIIKGSDGSVYEAAYKGALVSPRLFGCIDGVGTVTGNTTRLNAMALFIDTDTIYQGIELDQAIEVVSPIDFKRCAFKGNDYPITYTGGTINATILTFGTLGITNSNRIEGINSQRVTSGLTTSGAGIKIINHKKSYVHIFESRGSHIGVHLYADDGFSNCTLDMGLIIDCKNHVLMEVHPTDGWINENYFHKGQLNTPSTTPYTNITQIKMGADGITHGLNNNVWWQPNLETVRDDVTHINMIRCDDNRFYSIRSESSFTPKIELGSATENSLRNVIDFYNSHHIPTINRNNILDSTEITTGGRANIYDHKITISPKDLYYYRTNAGSIASSWFKSLKGDFIPRPTTDITSGNDGERGYKKVDGIDIASSYGILGAYFKVDNDNSMIRVRWNCNRWRAKIKCFDVNGDILEDDGMSASASCTWDATNKVYSNGADQDEGNSITVYPNSACKFIHVGVNGFSGSPGKDMMLSGVGVSLLNDPTRNPIRMSQTVPDAGYHDLGDLYYHEGDLTTRWLCTQAGDFNDVGNEPIFEELKAEANANSTATDVPGIVSDFNALLADLRSANIIKT